MRSGVAGAGGVESAPGPQPRAVPVGNTRNHQAAPELQAVRDAKPTGSVRRAEAAFSSLQKPFHGGRHDCSFLMSAGREPFHGGIVGTSGCLCLLGGGRNSGGFWAGSLLVVFETGVFLIFK